ncbi:MAG: hypothetical protein RLZ62_434 [Bacteroidota bacterium]|jgi:hypothetical protein
MFQGVNDNCIILSDRIYTIKAGAEQEKRALFGPYRSGGGWIFIAGPGRVPVSPEND